MWELTAAMPATEYEEWKWVYSEFDPFGNRREDLRAGSIAAPLLNLWVKPGSHKAVPSDWIMDFGKSGTSPRQSTKQMAMICQMFAAAHKQTPGRGQKKKRGK